MKNIIKLICLLLCIVFVFCSCNKASSDIPDIEQSSQYTYNNKTQSVSSDPLLNKPLKIKEPEYAEVTESYELKDAKAFLLLQKEGERSMPTGCEVTSLTMALNFLGYDITKEVLTDEFLLCDPLCESSPFDAFIGTPYSQYYGCYSPVIEKTANNYLTNIGSKIKATAFYNRKGVNMSGLNANILYSAVKRGFPVIVWATINLAEPTYGPKLKDRENNREFRWIRSEHCMVLIGYSKKTVTVLDPLLGVKEYDRELFEFRYHQLGRQSVILSN